MSNDKEGVIDYGKLVKEARDREFWRPYPPVNYTPMRPSDLLTSDEIEIADYIDLSPNPTDIELVGEGL